MNVNRISAEVSKITQKFEPPKWLPKDYEYIEKSSTLQEELNEIIQYGKKNMNTSYTNAEYFINELI